MLVPLNRALRHGVAAALVIASVGGSSPVRANETFTCDASDGGYREAEVEVPRNAHLVRGRMVFESRDFSGGDIPSAHIAFGDSASPPDPEHCFCKGIRAQIFPEEPDTVKFYAVSNGHAVGVAQGPVGVPLTFSFAIDGSGVMTASFGRTNPRVNRSKLTNRRRDRLHLTCTSARVRFLDVHME